MNNFKLRTVEMSDISVWVQLSQEYDIYVKELVGDLTQWYDGNETDRSFDDYMKAKIQKKEAIMATQNGICQGIIAFSRTHNRITFFAIAHNADFESVSKLLIDYTFTQLDTEKKISVNVIKSNAQIIQKELKIFSDYGFTFSSEELENGVPVNTLCRI